MIRSLIRTFALTLPLAGLCSVITLSGLRPGIDGVWMVTQVDHTYDRASGFRTRLEVLAKSIAPTQLPGAWPL